MDALLWIIFLIFILSVTLMYTDIKGRIYWPKKGMRVLDPRLYEKFKKLGPLQYTAKIYNLCKLHGLKHMGGYEYFTPVYCPIDLEIVRCILYKNFEYFTDRPFYNNETVDPMTANLFQLNGKKWLAARKKLTPAFTTGKMKMMFETIVDCTRSLIESLRTSSKAKVPFNAREILSRFIIDVIGSCAFGIECNCLQNPDAEFWKQCSRVFLPPRRLRFILNISRIIPKWLMTTLKIRTTEKEIDDFFLTLVRKTIQYREKNNISRKDFMQMMIELKNEEMIENDEATLLEITAHCYTFLTAGYETSAMSLTFALYEIALNPDIQEKLREEIRDALEQSGGKITYESVMNICYLDQVVNETLRKHPPSQTLFRTCTKRFQVPNTNVVLDPGTIVVISVFGIHRDPEYYPEPDKFIPERFNEENRSERPSCTFQPFGGGPRNCIASRFGTMQTKIGLVAIINNFKISINKKTPDPLKYKPECLLVCCVDGDIWLNVEKID